MDFSRPVCGMYAYFARSFPGCWARCALDYMRHSLRRGAGIPMLAVAGGNIPEGSIPLEARQAQQPAGAIASGGVDVPEPSADTAGVVADIAQADAPAQVAVGAEPPLLPEYSWTGYFMALGFMFVMLAMLWFGAKYLKNKGALRLFGGTSDLAMETRLNLGAKKHLLVVRYRGKRLLLGITDHHISLLDSTALKDYQDYSDDDAENDIPDASGDTLEEHNKSNFRDLINGFVKKQ